MQPGRFSRRMYAIRQGVHICCIARSFVRGAAYVLRDTCYVIYDAAPSRKEGAAYHAARITGDGSRYLPNSAIALATTFSAVIPRCAITAGPLPDSPKRLMPTIAPAEPT